MTTEEKLTKYHANCHAVQSGVAQMMHVDPGFTTPKHLRVGIDLTKSDHGALAKLLIDKGIITEEEYVDAVLDFTEREKASYEKRLSDHYGITITLA